MFEARPVQTKVKHQILERYLKAWGGIITNGAKGRIIQAMQHGVHAKLHFVYVDCFSGHGSYDGELDDKERGVAGSFVPGSPIIGIRALDGFVEVGQRAGIPVVVNSILIEKEDDGFSALQESLEKVGLSNRVQRMTDFTRLKNKEIALIHGDSTGLVNQLLSFTTAKDIFAFYFLDPYGPTGIPLDIVKQIINQQKHDVLINMPYQDLHKKSGILSKQRLLPAEISILNNYDQMFGSPTWRHIAKSWAMSKDSRQTQDLELQLANHYRDALKGTGPDLSIKSLPLLFSDRERTMFHLYLTTHDPSGALQMNQIIADAGYTEHNLRWQLKHTRETKGGMQMSLFSPEEMIPPKVDKREYGDEIADKLIDRFSGSLTNLKEIYQFFIDDPYLPKEIHAALTKLKNSKRADFDGAASSLKYQTTIKIIK